MNDRFEDVYDLKTFYSRRAGRLVRRILLAHIERLWPDLKDTSLLACGYGVPYLRALSQDTRQSFAFMTEGQGVHRWPIEKQNKVTLGSEDAWPYETDSVDRILMIHSLENMQRPDLALQEAWRVLKSNGRILMVVPNRLGLWSRADWTPFGHGKPYTAAQLQADLKEALFVTERREKALFMPPFKSFLVLKTAYTFEGFGKFVFPGLAGLHIIEATKQIYAGTPVKKQSKKKHYIMVGKTAPSG